MVTILFMFILIICSISTIFIATILILKKQPQFKIKTEQPSVVFIEQDIKNRKMSSIINKNTTQNASLYKYYFNSKALYYKKLSKFTLTKKIKKIYSLNTNLVYSETNTRNHYKLLLPLSIKTQKEINHNKTTYRAIGKNCLIENVAFNLAKGVLVKDKFDIFKEFESYCSFTKVYKKEAKILNTLVVCELLKIYYKLAKDVLVLKLKILRAKKLKTIKNPNRLCYQTIYGIYLFNKQGTKLIKQHNLDIIKATTEVINELDQISIKQKVIYNYLKLLSRS